MVKQLKKKNMSTTFYCEKCGKKFDSEGTKKEFNDPIYGPCQTNVASCPDCSCESSEYKEPKPQKSTIGYSTPSCSGGCCCGG